MRFEQGGKLGQKIVSKKMIIITAATSVITMATRTGSGCQRPLEIAKGGAVVPDSKVAIFCCCVLIVVTLVLLLSIFFW